MENQLFNLLWTTAVHLLGPQLQLPKTKYLLTITSLDPLPTAAVSKHWLLS